MSKASLRVDGAGAATARALPIGEPCHSGDPFLVPSVVLVESGRITFGPNALARAKAASEDASEPLLSFKTILSASDVAQALALKVPASVDPTRTFSYREVLSLYLAFLDQLVRRAIATNPPVEGQIAWRYTSPVWRTHGEAKASFARLFDEAAHLSQSLGAMLMFSEGVSIAHARHALDLASRGPDLGLLQLEVFEADAAAQAYAQLCPNPSRALLVFDMGAGTTDFAGFILSEDGTGRTLEELTAARQCIGLAGDEIDAILVEVAQEKIATKTRAQSRALARMLALEAREAKRILFQTGRCQLISPSGKRVQIKRSEIERHPLFREFAAALREAFTHSLTPLFAEARARGIDKVSVILAGGGSNLALLADIARRAGPDIEVVRFEETWGGFKDSAGAALPQTAIVIGGALTR